MKKIILFSKPLSTGQNALISNYLLISFSISFPIKYILPSTKDLSLNFLEIFPLSFKENNYNELYNGFLTMFLFLQQK